MTRRWTWWLAWTLCGLGLAPLPPIVVLAAINRDAPQVWTLADPQSSVLAVVCSVVGALLAAHRPGNALGWVFLVIGVLGQLGALAVHWAVYGLLTRPGTTGGAHALWIGLALAGAALAASASFPLLLFPDGRLSQWRTRVVALVAGVATTVLPLALITGSEAPPAFPSLFARTPNPLALQEGPLSDPGLTVEGFAIQTIALCGLASIGFLLARFRAARGVTRQQYKWIVLAMAFVVVAFIADFVARSTGTSWHVVTNPAQMLAFALVPAAMGVAILRYHLWDIDLIISRTLAYVALSASVVAIYVLVVGWLGTIFRTGGNLLFSLVATGIVAVAFQPLRERIQRAVNRLFYGERDEPYAVIARLGRRLEDTFAPEAVLPAIAGTVREALRLPYTAIAFQQAGRPVVAAAIGEPVPEPVRVPLAYQHEPIGELLLAPRPGETTFSPADRRLLDDLARQAGVAVHAVRLTSELQQARERLVEAREEERRCLRRDLHDGLGSRLAALTMQTGVLRGAIASDPARAEALAVEIRAELREAISGIRRIVHDLRPAVLDELGLAEALRARVRQYDSPGLAVRLEVPASLPPLSAAAEVAVYRIAEEALANVGRHAGASHCCVRLRVDDALELTIEDDGAGIDPTARAGLGLRSMRERAEELGGTCEIGPGADGGTRVQARLPLGRETADAA